MLAQFENSEPGHTDAIQLIIKDNQHFEPSTPLKPKSAANATRWHPSDFAPSRSLLQPLQAIATSACIPMTNTVDSPSLLVGFVTFPLASLY